MAGGRGEGAVQAVRVVEANGGGKAQGGTAAGGRAEVVAAGGTVRGGAGTEGEVEERPRGRLVGRVGRVGRESGLCGWLASARTSSYFESGGEGRARETSLTLISALRIPAPPQSRRQLRPPESRCSLQAHKR